ncbi:LPS assembly protein LptD [Helicobacter sp. MIT 05-5294]|uniref:LPS-assembly protein LptD n=1 Tax=Helicobacter sp. MIT 05-5294 TaxID=1548150 RepID=UPI00051FA938|nr:LPS assembly protein LptD [Helicobacter sp. MIT 05-5294]TLD89277.1 LPS-assembly protein LptD [Helicobacter sp. MIT 05-5294]
MLKLSKFGISLGVATLALLTPNLSFARPSVQQFNSHQEAVFEFLADDMEYSESKVIGKGHATVINLDYFVTANEATYDTQSGEIVLSGNVNAYKGNALYLRAQNVKIKMQQDYSFLEPFYLQDSMSGLWVDAKSAQYDKNVYQTEETTISTCSVNNPIWQLKASRSQYDVNEEWLSVWNPRLCIYDMPVLYFPYLSFSLGYKRKSGLLYPVIGNSNDDGILYAQPIFIAPEDWWDMTLTPQVRSKRGVGVYDEIRIIDDKDEILWANFGYFGDSNSYQKTYDLENRDHFGFQLKYERKDLLTESQDYFYEDGIYTDIAQVSDIDYFRLSNDELEDKADLQGSLLTSRLNYFIKSEADYIGLYGRYYSDLDKTSNAETLQTLPQVQYHRQMESLFLDNLYYSFDYQAKNFTRPIGYRAVQQEAQLPIIYTQSILDDFVNLSASPVFYGTQINYSNTKQERLEDGRYFSQHYRFKANSDVAKQYEDFGHTLSLETLYILPGFDDQKGDFQDIVVLPGNRQELQLSASQYFYDLNNVLVLSHRIRQPFYLEDDHKTGELENEIQYFYNYEWSFLSSIFYSHREADIAEATHQVRYDGEYFKANLGHFLRRSFADVDWNRGRFGVANYLTAGLEKEFEGIDIFASAGYDYKESYFKTWQVGFETSIRCFSFGVKYVSEIYPTLTTRGAEAKDDKYVLFTIKFIPLLSSDLKVGN